MLLSTTLGSILSAITFNINITDQTHFQTRVIENKKFIKWNSYKVLKIIVLRSLRVSLDSCLVELVEFFAQMKYTEISIMHR